jgi:cellulose synthase/poly-beta-1,6-N-acetylglucosamine synthase-like glycosyltransferase
VPSAEALGVPVIHTHGGTLRDSRNGALALVNTEWVIFLDADDELEEGYIEAMAAGTADVRVPAVRYVAAAATSTRARMPMVAGHRHACTGDCLAFGNWIVIGAAVRTDLVRKVGGWRDFPWSEDYDLWARCWLAGATFEPVPTAVYRAYVRRDSRNRAPDPGAKLAAHRAIAVANGLPVP